MPTQDDFSQDKSTTGVIQVGTPAKGKFDAALDADWFAVELKAGQCYLFNLRLDNAYPDSYNDFQLRMYDAAGVAVSDPVYADITRHVNPTLEFVPTSSGTYYIAAQAAAFTGALGPYTLTQTIREAADDYAADSTTTASITQDVVFSGKFEVAGDVDWVKFHADAGLHYSFASLAAPAGSTANVYPSVVAVRDKAGKVISSAGSFDPAESGDYYVSLVGLTAGNYSIRYTVSADDYSDNLLRTGAIAPAGKATGKIDYRYDQDMFKLPSLEAGKIYTVTLTGDAATFRINVLDTELFGIASASGKTGTGSVVLAFTAKASGDAYIRIGTDSATPFKDVLNYAISVSAPETDDVGDTAASALPAAVDQSVNGVLQSLSDVDMFKATLEAGVTYSFALTGAKVANSSVKIVLTGADGVSQTISGDGLKYYTFTPTRAGEYYAAISSNASVVANVAYQLTVGRPADDAGAAVANATPLAIGTSFSGALETGGGDRDWYAVQLNAGTTYWFKAQPAGSTLTSGGALRLLDASGKELAATGSNYGSLTDTLAFKASQSGTYYVEMSSPNRYVGAYTMTAKVGKADDYGATTATARSVPYGTTLKGELEVALDKDMFKLNVEAGKAYAFKFDGAPYEVSFALGLTDSAGKAMYFQSNYGIPANQKVFVATTTGTVYLTVGGAYGASYYNQDGRAYTLSAIDYGVDESGEAKETAALLAIGTEREAKITYIGDRDMYRVSLVAGKSYVFSMPDNIATGSFALVDEYGSALGANRNDGAEQRIGYTATKTGDYYLRVDGRGNFTGNYAIKATQLTGDAVGPSLVSSTVIDGAAEVPLSGTTFKLVFSEAIAIDAAAIRVLDGAGKPLTFAYSYNSSMPGAPTAADNTLEFKLNHTFVPGGSYTIELPRGAIHDLAGNAHSGPEVIKFTAALNSVTGTAGNDVFVGARGNTINGGAGVDTVQYSGSSFSHPITRVGSKIQVQSNNNGTLVFDVLEQVERLKFGSYSLALDIDGIGGQAYRLYRAAFNRAPDMDGIGHWIAQMDKGLALETVAGHFVASVEFKSLYGSALSNSAFLNQLYSNVLGRAADADGFNFWDKAMSSGVSREQVLVHFSESAENVSALASVIGNGFHYTSY